MLIQYVYTKPRLQFGKQCIFEESRPVAQENILPDPERTRDYIYQTECHRAVQNATQFSVHEVQTISQCMKNKGILHTEGGWPKEIKLKDEEAVQRYRRRVERDENWALNMQRIMAPMEYYICQNNILNIYENYFDDMIPTPLVMQYEVRTKNVYEDPSEDVRPVSHLSWSPGGANRLAASYSFMEFEVSPVDVNPCSYIWDIENPNVALMSLKSSTPLLSIEFNPRDPSMLASGLMTGQVCNWDMRTGDKPVQVSHLLFSHRNPASQVLWITSKTNTEFFSSSPSGTIKWWDIRNLKKPTETLVMDLEDPTRADTVRAIGVSALQFEPTMGSRFLAGMENGIVVNVKRKSVNVAEKLASRFNCYTGPVISIDRNPFSTKHFLTVGDWCAKIWADDTKEGYLIATREEDVYLTGSCWSRSKCSVFFTINREGVLEVYDILTGVDRSITSFRLCDASLTAISPHEDGEVLAVGSRNGNIYLVQCSEGLTTTSKNEKVIQSIYLERCSRFEKAVDNRLKEMRLLQEQVPEEASMKPVQKLKGDKGNNKAKMHDGKERAKSKETEKVKEKAEHVKKKRSKRMGKNSTYFTDDVELIDAEIDYFRTIEAESAKLQYLEDLEAEGASYTGQEMSERKKKQVEPIAEKTELKKERKGVRDRARSRRRKPLPKPVQKLKDAGKEEEIVSETDVEALKTKQVKKRRGGRKRVCEIEVCKPKVCCMDKEEARKAKKKLEDKQKSEVPKDIVVPPKTKLFAKKDKWYKKLCEIVAKIPECSPAQKRRILIEKNAPPDFLRQKVEEAKKAIRSSRKWMVFGKYDRYGTLQRSVDNESKKKMDEKVVTDDEKETVLLQSNERQPVKKTSERHQQSVQKDESLEKKDKNVHKSKDIISSFSKIPKVSSDYKMKDDKSMKKQKKQVETLKNVTFVEEELYPRISSVVIAKYLEEPKNLEGK